MGLEGKSDGRPPFERLYLELRTGLEIEAAAREAGVYSVPQMHALLAPKARLVERAAADGVEWVPMIESEGTDPDSGRPTATLRRPADEIAHMRRHPALYGNFFRDGIGGTAADAPDADDDGVSLVVNRPR